MKSLDSLSRFICVFVCLCVSEQAHASVWTHLLKLPVQMQILGNTGAPHNPLTILSCGKILQMSPVHNLHPLPFPEESISQDNKHPEVWACRKHNSELALGSTAQWYCIDDAEILMRLLGSLRISRQTELTGACLIVLSISAINLTAISSDHLWKF